MTIISFLVLLFLRTAALPHFFYIPLAQNLSRGYTLKLGLSEVDKFDIFEKDGTICLMPVAVYPKKYLDELKEEIGSVKSGEQPVFDSVDALLDKLDAE